VNRRRGLTVVLSVGALLALGACSSSGRTSSAIASLDELPDEAASTSAVGSVGAGTTTAVVSEREEACKADHLETASFRPAESDDGFIARLRELGRIRVGVDENTRGLSFRNPLTGEFEGFEVGLAEEIARRLFPDADPATTLVLVPLVTDEKTNAVADDQVDLTISAVSMSCDRWEQVDFSAEYYTAHQKFLVRSDSGIQTRSDLDGRTVCVTSKSSSLKILRREVPAATALERPARTDCLLALQLREADAYFGHDTFLYGMLEQDQTVEIQDLLDPEDTTSHYGIAVNKRHPELTALINVYLQQIIADGTWDDLYEGSLAKLLPSDTPHASAPDPDPRYRDG
jgi:polar amino acid transport system substrate-binding protein